MMLEKMVLMLVMINGVDDDESSTYLLILDFSCILPLIVLYSCFCHPICLLIHYTSQIDL